MNVLLLVPDGVGVRNFVLGPFLKTVTQEHKVSALHVIPDSLLTHYRNDSLNGHVAWHALLPFRERPVAYTLRNSVSYSQTYWINNFPMRVMRDRPVRGSWRTRLAVRVAKMIGYCAAFPRGMALLDEVHAAVAGRLPEVAKYRKHFEASRPDVLFCSHQRPPSILPPVLAARSLGIPTATFIFSWDNLSSKGRIAAPFDHYLVWSDHMRGELAKYYPHIGPERVHVVGTPQFDPYGNEGIIVSREEFCRRIEADPARPLICFSGGDVDNSREDHLHVRTLMQLIRSGDILGQPQVVLRPAPVDAGTRYESVRRDYPELLYAQPNWVHASEGVWSSVFPLPSDVEFLANLTHHCDLNINFASTMTLDFALRDKPVINVAFDVSNPPVFGMPMWEYYQQWEHYRPVIEFGAARFARSPAELAEHVNAYLRDPALDREGRRKFVELEVGAPVGTASENILAALKRIAR